MGMEGAEEAMVWAGMGVYRLVNGGEGKEYRKVVVAIGAVGVVMGEEGEHHTDEPLGKKKIFRQCCLIELWFDGRWGYQGKKGDLT